MMLGFLLQNAGKDFKNNAFITAVLSVISFVGILATLYAGNLVWEIWQNYLFSRIPEADHLFVTEFFPHSEGAQTENKIRHLLTGSLKEKPDKLEFCGFMNMTVEWGEEAAVCKVQGDTEGFSQIHQYKVLEGQGFEHLFADPDSCIIRENGTLDERGIGVGDVITVNGEAFTVAGVVKFPLSYGEIHLPFERFAEMAGNQKYQYQALFYYEEELPKLMKLRGAVGQKADLTESCTGVEHQAIYRNSIIQSSMEKIIPAAMLFLFAGVGFFVMIKGKLFLEQKRIGIRMSLGASEKMTLAENMMLIECIICAAFLVACFGYRILALFLTGLGRRMNAPVGVFVLAVYSLLGVTIDGFSLRSLLRKKSGYQVLKGY